jgi:hypothetical protein
MALPCAQSIAHAFAAGVLSHFCSSDLLFLALILLILKVIPLKNSSFILFFVGPDKPLTQAFSFYLLTRTVWLLFLLLTLFALCGGGLRATGAGAAWRPWAPCC